MTIRRTLAPCPQYIPAPNRESHIADAVTKMEQVRSLVISELDMECDSFIRTTILQFLGDAELSLQKALA